MKVCHCVQYFALCSLYFCLTFSFFIIVACQDVSEGWSWQHTFVNEDEIQMVQESGSYLHLRVKVKEVTNSTLLVQVFLVFKLTGQ